jgi:hypothetical protein
MAQRKPAASAIALDAVARFLADAESNGDVVASALSTHLANLTTENLPPAAHDAWRKIAQLLRAPADRPISDNAALAVRSWPQKRIADLIGLLRDLQAILATVENHRIEDEIRDSIRRHYL